MVYLEKVAEKDESILNVEDVISEKAIEEILKTLELNDSEKFELLEINKYRNSRTEVDLKYTSNRCTHLYQLHIRYLPDGCYEMYTYIKNIRNGINITRNLKTTVITDKLIFAFSNSIWETSGKIAYPDYFEIKRFVKFLFPDFLCYRLSSDYASKYLTRLPEGILSLRGFL